VHRYGAACVVMLFDESGQAVTVEHKLRIARRAYHLLTEKAGMKPQDIIFDPNVLTVGTGIEEHNRYALSFIEATRQIKELFPDVKVSGGVSNVSFAFRSSERGTLWVRRAMHAAFLYHAIRAGLDMAIVNAGQLDVYEEIPEDLRGRVEDVLLDRRPDATERLIDLAQSLREQQGPTDKAEHDDYSAIMTKALADRLVEAFAERLHQIARADWGYGRDEQLTSEDLIDEKYRGIRPAPGYPACPDHTEKLTLFRVLDAERHTGIRLTETMVMDPGASVCGWYFAHPQSRYFSVDRITRDQAEDYARRKAMKLAEVERWLAPNLGYEPD